MYVVITFATFDGVDETRTLELFASLAEATLFARSERDDISRSIGREAVIQVFRLDADNCLRSYNAKSSPSPARKRGCRR